MIKILLLTIISTTTFSKIIHKCLHSEIIKTLPTLNKIQTKKKKKTLGRNLENLWRPINILFDFSNITAQDPKKAVYIKTLIKILKIKLEKIIMVQGESIILSFNQACDNSIKVPEKYSKEINSDLIVFLDFSLKLDAFAIAIPCSLQKSDNRPIIGKISVNENKLEIKKNFIENHVKILLHEIMHILAFSPKIFDNFKNQPVIKELENSNELITPKLLKEAKSHYNCDKINGVPLENENLSSKGIHFDKLKMGNELMTSNLSDFPVLSKLTLAFLEDSGWYRVDFTYSEKFYWGEQKGCDFFEGKKCDEKFKEFCGFENEGEENCSGDYRMKTVCKKIDECFVNDFLGFKHCTKNDFFRKTFEFEENGINSRCFKILEDDKKFSGCFKTNCDNGIVNVMINNKLYYCKEKGEVLSVNDDFEIVCPDIEDFCRKFHSNCFDDCYGNGNCLVDNSCYCNYFYSGFKCQNSIGCKLEDEGICEDLKQNSYDEIIEEYIKRFLICFFFIFIAV